MRFRLEHQRSTIGNDLTVSVGADNGQTIGEVAIGYDFFDLIRERLDPPVQSYERMFRQQGDAAPGQAHRLVVTAFDDSGKAEAATSEWEDET